MFNSLIDDASKRACTACERVRRLEGMVTKESLQTVERTAGQIARLGDTFGKLESLSVDDLKFSASAFTQAGDLLVKNTLGGINHDRARRAVSAATSALQRIGIKVPGIVQDANTIMGAMKLGEQLSASLGSAQSAVARVDKSLSAAFGSRAPLLPEIELTARKASGGRAPNPTSSTAHLLILVTMDTPSESFYFNLTATGYDSLRRQTSYNVASQDRLTRLPALQAVSKGGDTITVSGAIFTKKSGASQMNRLREIGFRMVPVMLTTGYGEALGQWYLSRIDEDQDGLFPDGMPRKQTFTLEFQRYGEDYSNL
ncbi:MAG: phage tail protein [Rhodoferax sp.]